LRWPGTRPILSESAIGSPSTAGPLPIRIDRLTRRATSALALLVGACSSPHNTTTAVVTPPDSTRYRNPVIDADFPDPALVRAPDGWFYAYATQTVRGGRQLNIQVARSRDLVTWTLLGEALPGRPAWSTRVWNFWAPHVVYDAAARRWLMYYAAEQDQGGKCVGIATASAPGGPFADVGAPLACGANGFNIDPMAFEDPASGRRFLYWGSSGSEPLRVQELAADGLSFAPGSAPRAVVAPNVDRDYGRLVEGPWVILRDGWYYLFYSGDDCCGAPPHYAVLVARSRDPLGPFERLGEANGTGHSEILVQDIAWRAPGHNAVVTDDAGTDWIVYHAVDADHPRQDEADFVRRPMLIDRLEYRDGWPRVAGGVPSSGLVARPVVTPPP
jgi:arabinan endo-1,5-alpha-L-arabinosidase